MEQKSFYITTPIYYVNDSPHIGHAYTTIACDVMARYQRLQGKEVKFLTGTDEHGQKVDKAASEKAIAPQDFVDEVSTRFRALVQDPLQDGGGENILNVSNDDFIRTTEPRHKDAAQALWKRMKANGHIYKGSYAGWYAVRDEAYYQESELVEGKAPTGAEVEWVEEESYFFDLSKWQDELLAFYDANPDFVVPNSRLNEVKQFVAGGLKDLSISRTTFQWGVPVPGDDTHVMYVWVDALTNYMTSAGFPDMESPNFKKFWSNCTEGPVHVVGKDILRFHAVYWPAFLMAAGLPLPEKIVAHGWWTIEGQKMSKSLGNVLSPADMIDVAGSVDGLRYCMLRAMPFGNDGDFSRTRMVEIINADLANNIGNLGQRTLTMIQKNCGGRIPDYGDLAQLCEKDRPLFLDKTHSAIAQYQSAMGGMCFHEALGSLMELGSMANEYITENAPWALKKTDENRMCQVLYVLAETLRIISIALQPFCPTAAAKLLDQLSVPEGDRSFDCLTAEYALKAGVALPVPEGVFPRLQLPKVQAA